MQVGQCSRSHASLKQTTCNAHEQVHPSLHEYWAGFQVETIHNNESSVTSKPHMVLHGDLDSSPI